MSHEDVRRIGDRVAAAPDLPAALDDLALETGRAFAARVCILRHTDRGWALAAQTNGGLGLALQDLTLVLDGLPAIDPAAPLDLSPYGIGTWTAVALAVRDARWLMLIEGDVTGLAATSSLAAMVPLALHEARARAQQRRADRGVMAGYAFTRRLSRARTLDAVCRAIVTHVADAARADRVSVAIGQPDTEQLRVVAACGDGAAALPGVSVEAGAWVMGHVYASRRPVVVPDLAHLPGRWRAAGTYRTTSFVSLPLIAGGNVVGVLNVTDRRDRTPLDRRDLRLLRSISATAALGIQAVLTSTEAERLARIASVDNLTTLFNRPYFETRLNQEMERAKRSASALTVLLADIDGFKTVNDTYGHQRGDSVLRAVGDTLRSAVRVFDICARYGGDEFAILMPSGGRASALACALAFAERIRHRVSAAAAPLADGAPVTLSIGLALLEPGDSPDSFIRRADEALYAAKAAGKDRVHLSVSPTNVLRLPLFNSGQGTAS